MLVPPAARAADGPHLSAPSPQSALPDRPLARALLLTLQSFPAAAEPADGWAAALFTVCTRPALIAVTGDGFGVTPPTDGDGTREPVVVVAQHLQRHLLPLSAQCVPAGTFTSGVYGLWQSAGATMLPPAQYVREWPDVVVQVGVATLLPQPYPVPLVLAPVDWSDPDTAAQALAVQCGRALAEERCVRLAMEVAAGSGFHSETLELMLRGRSGQ